MKKLFLLILFSSFSFAQDPQILQNVGQIIWQGSTLTGPCIWTVNTLTNTISTPCANSSSYVLPIATTSTLGGIKPDGTSITVNPTTGVASASGSASFTPNIYCVSTNSSGQIAQTINCNAFSYNAGDFINYGGTTGGNNGITNMLAYCKTLSPETCYATISPSYTGTDSIPGYSTDFTTPDYVTNSGIGSNTILIDERKGSRTMLTNGYCAIGYSNQCNATIQQSTTWTAQTGQSFPNYIIRQYKDTILAGGTNYNNGTYTNISNYQPTIYIMNRYTPGQGILNGTQNVGYAPGDVLGNSSSVVCFGGLSGAKTDEGCLNNDQITYQGGISWSALAVSGGTALSTLQVSAATQGGGTLGQERELLDTSSSAVVNGTVNTITCAAESGNVTTPCVVTIAATNLTPDTARGTAGTASGVGTIVLTPTFSVGSASNFSTTQLACISDGFETERLFPTAVSGSTITFNYTKPHLSTAIITTGSSTCGKDFSLNADTVNSTTFGTIPNGSVKLPASPPSGTTMLRVWKIVGSPANNQITVAFQGGGSYRQVASASRYTASNNGFTLYPAATIASISTTLGQNAGLGADATQTPIIAGGGTIGLLNNNMTITIGDTLNSPTGAAISVSNGNVILSTLFPSPFTAPGGYGLQYYGVWHDADCLFCITNNTPTSIYTASGSTLNPPVLFKETGSIGYTMLVPRGDVNVFNLGCSTLCNNSFQPFFLFTDSSGNGTKNSGTTGWYYDENLGQMRIYVKNNTLNYGFMVDGFEIPQLPDTSINISDSNTAKIWYSTTQNCVAFILQTSTKTCLGSGGSANATSIQGNPVATGSFTTAGQAYIWTGSTLAITQINSLQAGWGNTIANPSTGVQQINVGNAIRQVAIATDTISTTDCGGTIIYSFAGTTTVGIPQANSGTGNSVMPTTCFVNLISWTGNTANLTTTTSNFYSILGTNTSQAFSVSAARKQITSLGGNYYQTQ